MISVIKDLKEELKSAKKNFKWQKNGMKNKLKNLKQKSDQLLLISNSSEEQQLEMHFKILILNYLISNNFSEDLVKKLGNKQIIFFKRYT